jgi:hypothetical protein
MTTENTLFAGLEGADIDRLMACMEKVRDEGLRIDKYCQAGVNQSSGNVYIWSEDWAGCVYCSIGFDVSWSYSCPECGEEYDFDTEQECRDYCEKHDGQCEACREGEAE